MTKARVKSRTAALILMALCWLAVAQDNDVGIGGNTDSIKTWDFWELVEHLKQLGSFGSEDKDWGLEDEDGYSAVVIGRVMGGYMSIAHILYNRRLEKNPNLGGKVTLEFTINEHGNVILAKAAESTLGDTVFERSILERLKNWNFGRHYNPGTITEVIYPLFFMHGRVYIHPQKVTIIQTATGKRILFFVRPP